MKLPTYKGLVVSKSRNGLGIHATKVYKPKEVIFQVTGTFVTGYEDDDLPKEERNNLFRFNEELYIAPKGQIGDYLNHSCSPNAYIKKSRAGLFVMALFEIKRGNEVLIDYSTITASDDSWAMKCLCKSKKCRKTIKKFRTLTQDLKNLYIRKGMVPKYIQAI